MKNLLILIVLMISSFGLSTTSFATGSCTPNYLSYSYVECTFNGNGDSNSSYYKSTSNPVYLNLWGTVGAGGSYIYNYITTPGGFDYISVYFGNPSAYYSTWRWEDPGTIILYTESLGDNNVGGVSASW